MSPPSSPLTTAANVIKHMPSVSLKEQDSSQNNPNASDVSLHGDHNTVTLTSKSDMRQRKPQMSNIIIFLLITSNLLSSVLVLTLHDKAVKLSAAEKSESSTKADAKHIQMIADARSYTDNAMTKMISEVKNEFSKTTAAALNSAVATAQDGNRNIIRIQLIREYDTYLIDGVNTIKLRELEGIRTMYDYYLSINGNHDVPPRAFQFEQMIARKQITVTQ